MLYIFCQWKCLKIVKPENVLLQKIFYISFQMHFEHCKNYQKWVVIKIICTTVENHNFIGQFLLKYTRFNILIQWRNFSQVDFKKSKLTNSHWWRKFQNSKLCFRLSKFKFSQQPKEIFLHSLSVSKGNWMLYIFASVII